MFLIDTVTLSELRKRERDPMVVAWFERQRTTDLSSASSASAR
jgi:hypothetical protein